MSDRVTYVCENRVAQITMDDGKVNVMSKAMLDDIGAALEQAAKDEAVTVFRSARPGLFSAGFDLKTLSMGGEAAARAMVGAGVGLAIRFLTHPMPIVSVCEGHAYPMGAFLLLSSDYRLGCTGDYRVGLNEVAIGLTLPVFAMKLARARLHPAFAHRTAVGGELFQAEEARRAGFLDRLVAPDALEADLAAVVARLSGVDLLSFRATKAQLNETLVAELRREEAFYQGRADAGAAIA